MAIRVEFFGIARQRAGVGEVTIESPRGPICLADALTQIAAKIPALGGELIVLGQLHKSLAANLEGHRFISDPATSILDGQSLLILSADAGG